MEKASIGVGMLSLKPGKKRRSEVEARSFEIVNDLYDLALSVKGAGAGIGMIALVMNALVPIVKGSRAILLLDLFNPRIFTRRLIEMPVEADTNFSGHKGKFPP
jgi:hypothetical protein